ncbi:alpha,alpha-trehalase TreA [Ralstonia pseudosolanacearum]|uniref:Periplasmic trehalase n=1 Tax=Ralstonia solanacearum TaxID=305 RepID=A0AA92EHW2_RALSL|nr:alpha,alpha-trehalase TreA [Ralstonia pseudosolanacearum]QCX51328.1 alpha,alpha-trehalase TreA [Ralstonia pseudosolanacearum]
MLDPHGPARPSRFFPRFIDASASHIRRATAAALLAASLCALPACAEVGVGAALPLSPDKLYGELFVAVQTAQVYPDQKTFVDTVPKADPAVILQAYRAQKDVSGFSLKAFVDQYFAVPSETVITPPAGLSLRAHINWLWPALTRTTTTAPDNSSLIPLPKPYVVPGGRFREVYYWDTYFTMLGLQASGHDDLVDNMLDNFAYQINRFGHIPNGNRTYYLSRSQPPFFALMVELAAAKEGEAAYTRYLAPLRKEYAYWMRGAAGTAAGQASGNVVVLRDGTVLNRYWDDEATPRPESYLQDVATAQQAPDRPAAEVWRDLRAAAESGWDFSSRWFGDSATLATIRTTSILPVDLNALMFQLEKTIAKGCAVARDFACTVEFGNHARKRAVAVERYLWHPAGYYADYDWKLGKVRDNLSAAATYPLFVQMAPWGRARQTLRQTQTALLQVGGLSTTTLHTQQQWDAPNGWAPLQWIALQASQHYGQELLAQTIGERFLGSVERLYAAEQKLVEKYIVDGSGTGGGGGEYPLQDGFGWTNGVTLRLLDAYGRGQ